ncbi:MAG: hypothetical protein AAB502_09615, partial [Chloroflexota bacterium]
YGRLSASIQRKVDKAFLLLEKDFRHPGLRSHTVEGAEGIFEAYVDARYRVTFERQGNAFVLRNMDNHDDMELL